MRFFKCVPNLSILILMSIFFIIAQPEFSSGLRSLTDADLSEDSPSLKDQQSNPVPGKKNFERIDEKQLDDLSPALVAPQKVKKTSKDYLKYLFKQKYENSVCFQKCHQTNDFQPHDHTAKQWQLLIEQNGHSIFVPIPWNNLREKENVLNYLFQNSRKPIPQSSGIGVWE